MPSDQETASQSTLGPRLPWGCLCGRRWRGMNEAHCTVCHAQFSTVANFDRHRPNRPGCGDPATMTDRNGRRVFRARPTDHGPTWAENRDRPEHLHRYDPV